MFIKGLSRGTTMCICCLALYLLMCCNVLFPITFIPNKITENVYGYLSQNPTSHKSILILTGASGYDETYMKMAQQFQAEGWNTLILDYYRNGLDLPGKSVFSGTAEDYNKWKVNAKNAISLLVKNKYATVDSLVIIGFSRGSSIAFAVGNTDKRVSAIISFYGDLDVDEDDTKETINFAVKNLPPILLIHGKKDRVVPINRANFIANELKKRNKSFDKVFLNKMGHAFILDSTDENSVEATQHCIDKIESFLNNYSTMPSALNK